jgi:hypothetical protein
VELGKLESQNPWKVSPPKSFLSPKAERWAISLSFWIPRAHREPIRGDLMEDCKELREFGSTEWRIRIHVLWQLTIGVVALFPNAIISKVISSVIRKPGMPKNQE